MRKHRALRRRYAHSRTPHMHEGYEGKVWPYQKAFITSVTDGHVFLRLVPQGSNGHMPVASFLRQYKLVKKTVRADGRLGQ